MKTLFKSFNKKISSWTNFYRNPKVKLQSLETRSDFDIASYVFEVKNFSLWYADKEQKSLKNINVKIPTKQVTALIGPSGCGKSTLLRSFNRMNELIEGLKQEGIIFFKEQNIFDSTQIIENLRMRIGMVFQKPTVFPLSVFENVAYGLKANGITDPNYLNNAVEKALKQAALWEEVKDNLEKSGLSLSGGQQQRLCIARTIALEPEVLLMDEPTSALDPIAVSKIEELIISLAKNYTIILVSHSMSQVQRISDWTIFMQNGEIIEFDETRKIFTRPKMKKTKNYINGEY